jgi:hypothetical protein
MPDSICGFFLKSGCMFLANPNIIPVRAENQTPGATVTAGQKATGKSRRIREGIAAG